MPTCLVIQHLEPEGPYAIADALTAVGIDVEVCRVYEGDVVPDSAHPYPAVVVMGGPMSAHDDAGFPSRTAEIALLSDALERAVPVLGVCLGAQLLAAAGGGRTFAGAAGYEVGWGAVHLTRAADLDALFDGLPQTFEVLHWHGDTFDLPDGATLLAGSRHYAHQAFRLGGCAWGLQFHVEVDDTAVRAFLEHFGADAEAAGTSPASIATAAPAALAGLAPVRDLIVTRFAQLARSRARSVSETV